MNELQHTVSGAGASPLSAWIASALTAVFGSSAYYELIPALLGALSALPLGILSCVLVFGQIKKGRLERKQLHMQIALLAAKEAKRLKEGGFEERADS